MKKYLIQLFAFLVLSTSYVDAQNEEGKSGTVYSSFGIGMPINANGAQEKSLGILGTSFNEVGSPGLSNPAFWGAGSFTRISANIGFTSYSIKDNQDTGNNSLLNINNFQAVFPLIKDRLGLSAALYPETRTSYNVNSFETIDYGNSDFEYFSNRVGSGGITKFEMGLGLKLSKNFAVGYAPSYSFLTEKENRTTQIFNEDLTANTVTQKVNGTSFSHRIGGIISFNNVIFDSDYFRIGATLNFETKYDAERKSETFKIVGNQSQEVQIGTKETGTVSTPLKYSTGLTYYPSNKFNFSIEYLNEKWNDVSYDFSQAEENVLKNRSFYGVGLQFHPYKSRSDKFLSNFKYSLGASYDTGHLNIQGEKISTLWFSAGLGLFSPNVRSTSSFDLSFQYGMRGTTNQNLVKENIFSINLSINLTELMFLQRKLN